MMKRKLKGKTMTDSSQEQNSIRVMYHQMVRMRDGVHLSADILLPEKEGPFPVILIRTPYGNHDKARLEQKIWLAKHGFAVVFQDCRGRHDSEGEWEPFRFEAEDGVDTLDWISKQIFCNGNIGMMGGSYEGYCCWMAAIQSPHSLKALIPIVPLPDPVVNVPYQNGAFFWNMIVWGLMVHGRTNQEVSMVDWPQYYLTFPLKQMAEKVGFDSQAWKHWMLHTSKDEWWKKVCYQHLLHQVNIPVLHISGWYDDDGIATFLNYPVMRKHPNQLVSENQSLIIGAWPHKINKNQKIGQVDFGSTCLIDLNQQIAQFFRKHLAGDPVPDNTSRCRLFIMGDNQWIGTNDWPMEGTEQTRLYLHSHGSANSVNGDGWLSFDPPQLEMTDSFLFDPSHPVPYLTDPNTLQLGEAYDQAEIEKRDDVLVYSTLPLEKDLVVCGRILLHLWVQSDASGTDFTGKLVDVWPTGEAIQVNDGIQRAEFRNNLEKPDWLSPDQVYPITIDLWATGINFKKGHRIRIEVSSSAVPKFYPHHNTKEIQSEAVEWKKANQTVFHQKDRESFLEIQTIPHELVTNNVIEL